MQCSDVLCNVCCATIKVKAYENNGLDDKKPVQVNDRDTKEMPFLNIILIKNTLNKNFNA